MRCVAGARLSYVEAKPGAMVVLPSWMLDPIVCNDMALGEPHVDVEALKDLSQLLVLRGFRRSSSGEARFAKEEQNEGVARAHRNKAAATGGAALLEVTERRKIIVCLANLLRQVAGEAAEEESSDDER